MGAEFGAPLVIAIIMRLTRSRQQLVRTASQRDIFLRLHGFRQTAQTHGIAVEPAVIAAVDAAHAPFHCAVEFLQIGILRQMRRQLDRIDDALQRETLGHFLQRGLQYIADRVAVMADDGLDGLPAAEDIAMTGNKDIRRQAEEFIQ